MNQEQLNELLEELSDSAKWLKDSFAGVSPEFEEFISSAKGIASKPKNEADGGLVVCCMRIGHSRRLDEDFARIFGFENNPHVTLQPGADAYNACELFGLGSRAGVFESLSESVVVSGMEHLAEAAVERFCGHAEIWVGRNIKRILLIGDPNSKAFPLIDGLEHSVSKLVFPALSSRAKDIPFVIEDAARRRNGGLSLLTLEASNRLITHDWPGDIEQVDKVIGRIFVSNSESSISQSVVDECLAACQQSVKGTQDQLNLWQDVQNARSEIDRLTTSLAEFPFFASKIAATTKSPLASESPELNFFRLVSWAYVDVVEKAEPNLRIIAKLFQGQRLKPDRVLEIRASVGSLRTFLQHSLQYGEERDQQTISRTASWFQCAIGKRQPTASDYEHCIEKLLLELKELYSEILRFLNRVNDDEFRSISLAQWKSQRETEWPKYKFGQIVGVAIENLGRQDLNANVVCDKLLETLRSRLKATNESEDRTGILLSLSENEIDNKFPLLLPITGKEIIELGVPQGPKVGEIRKSLQEEFENGTTAKADLLEIATELVKNL